MRDDPRLRQGPVAVGGKQDQRGVIATCNYEARKFGVHSAMSSSKAMNLCPSLILVPARMDVYRDVSRQMREIFFDYTDLVEPLSLDEAYLDVSHSSLCHGSATLIAEEIRQRIAKKLKITVSAGVAPNKFLAKVASEWKKPDGLTVVSPDRIDSFVQRLPVSYIHGVGKVTTEKMRSCGINICADIRQKNIYELYKLFGVFGSKLYEFSHGRDDREVVSQRQRKSLSVENTYVEDLPDLSACLSHLPLLYSQLESRLDTIDECYKTTKAFVKIKFNDFSGTTLERLGTSVDLENYRELLMEAFERGNKPVRLLGLGVRFISLTSENGFLQLPLFK
ncbi:UNVERIFIED_CONTAM: hypothetical protein GTU68_060396 [Idotea baltica]|nr:hypothetical protein [Idotea baltica]